MSIRHLESFFVPQSVAVFGATERPGAIGSVITQNILTGGFAGRVYGVNPHYNAVHGAPCHADADALPEAPELAVIASPFESAAGIVSALGRRGTRAVVLISAPGGEASAITRARAALLEAACAHDVRIVGPNCLGIMAPHAALNATFAPLGATPGRLAFVAQSGALATSMVDWARMHGIGFSAVFSLGDMVDVDFGDMLDFLASDPHTDAILLYIESVTNARKFVSAARAASRTKPVIAVKGGRFAAGARAAATHTGALVGSDAVYDAVFRRTGIVRVDTLEELFDAAGALSRIKRLPGERLAIVTNGGGMAVLAADALAARHGSLATLSPETHAALDGFLPRNWSRANPVDVIGDAGPERLARAAATVVKDPGVDAVLVVHCPTAVCPSREAAEALVASGAQGLPAMLLASWVGGSGAADAHRCFDDVGIPAFATPEQAIRAFMQAVAHRRGQAALMQTPETAPEPRRE
ncbi:MAG: acetate--CoA ligase family protein, partial [Gammaproteobacteria bacterium]